ncbi:MAG: hypothetical protein J6K29_03300 [Clostridia bacterium]|nr:hypothetical protein [Clostridia bacterium]
MMKRFWSILIALCLSSVFLVPVLPARAAEEAWSVYCLEPDEQGMPHYQAPPHFAYTEKGLVITAREGSRSFTAQTAYPCDLSRGFYMEITLERPVEMAALAFHVWEQNGVAVSNYHCGSGWQGILQVTEQERQYMASINILGSPSPDKPGSAGILGNMAVDAPVNPDGTITYSLSFRDDILRINGTDVVGHEDILMFLSTLRSDESFFVGITMTTSDPASAVPVTITRFGVDRDSATVPGREPPPSDTRPAETDQDPAPPEDSRPSEPGETKPFEPSETKPSEPPASGNTENTTSDEEGGEHTNPIEEVTTGKIVEDFDSPYRETEPETRKPFGGEDEMKSFIDKLEKWATEGCGSLLDFAGMWMIALFTGLGLLLRKRGY